MSSTATNTVAAVVVIAITLWFFLVQQKQTAAPLTPDTLVINARIWTANEKQPWAQAMALAGDRIVRVGTTADINRLYNTGVSRDLRIIDAAKLGGKIIVPGFHDCHIHLMLGGNSLMEVQLRDANKQEFIERVAKFAASKPAGRWLKGGHWNHENWGAELPHHDWIDDVTKNNPAYLWRLDGHMGLVNKLALQLANITKDTPEVEGGTIVRDQNGEPTGMLKDAAMNLIEKILPRATPDEEAEEFLAAMKYVASLGITSVHNMGTWEELEVFDRFNNTKDQLTRIYHAVPLPTWSRLAERIKKQGWGDNMLRIGNLKEYMDGSLGSHTALMFEKYSDSQSQSDVGLSMHKDEEYEEWIRGADKEGFQVSIHAIGDLAIHKLLDIYERVFNGNGTAVKAEPKRERRFRIEHSQQIAEMDLHRYHDLGVIASVQSYHLMDDGVWAEKLIGDRIKRLYVFKSLLQSGVVLAGGSDWFVAPASPIEGIRAFVTRETLDGKNPEGFVVNEKISVEQALRAYTIDAAFAGFDEHLKGSLEEGKLADFVMLDQDLLSVPAKSIKDTRVLMTVLGGRVVYAADDVQLAQQQQDDREL